MNQSTSFNILKFGLFGNATFSAISALALIVAAEPIANLIGLSEPTSLIVVGFLLIPFAVHLWIAARRTQMKPLEIMYFCTMDAFWIVGSAILLTTQLIPFSTAGMWGIAIVALIVADFLLLQLYGLVRLRRPVQTL